MNSNFHVFLLPSVSTGLGPDFVPDFILVLAFPLHSAFSCEVQKEKTSRQAIYGQYLTKFCAGRLRPEVQRLTFLYAFFFKEKVPLGIPSSGKC